MPDLYLIIVFILFALAITDLVVGVSNDAVNFLNSAIGSRVAKRHIIMIVASLGIFVGATFSSGMMEVARKGIFNPDYFFFDEIMVIFLAVMLTDIILLDVFNTFGMPTSTTVSIVFELLGASVAIAFMKVLEQGDSIVLIGEYINSGSALAIIAGIFLSVSVAFLVGSLVQWLSRLLFSFHYEQRMKWVGALWSGLAMATMTYFLLMKGAKGASFLSDEVVAWVGNNTIPLLLGSFLGWTALMQLLHSIFKVNMLRVVVLFGTFSLAMAFAGNDLVNFIGVPIAGFESYLSWTDSGIAADSYTMEILTTKVKTPTYLLLIAGAIMIVTLWLSRKARTVTETEVNLGRQDDGSERFTPNALAQGIVRISRNIGNAVEKVVPPILLRKIQNNFQPYKPKLEKGKLPPAFDMVRASVNLTTASMLIAMATSMKLPLSTTYVSFMVAMGTSLADQAWGRDSAVFRVSGVLNVIGGWFLTAIVAFTVAGLFAILIHWLGIWAIAGLVMLAIFLISRTFGLHRKREKEKAESERSEFAEKPFESQEVIPQLASKIRVLLQSIVRTYEFAVEGLLNENREQLQVAREDLFSLRRQNKSLRKRLYKSIQRLEGNKNETSRLYLLLYDYEQDIIQSIQLIVNSCYDYVANSLNPLTPLQQDEIRKLKKELIVYLELLTEAIPDRTPEQKVQVKGQKASLLLQIENLLSVQVQGIKDKVFGTRNSDMYFSLLLETKDLVEVAARFAKLFAKLKKSQRDNEVPHLLESEE